MPEQWEEAFEKKYEFPVGSSSARWYESPFKLGFEAGIAQAAKEREVLKELAEALIEAAALFGKMESQSEHGLPYEFKQLKIKIDRAILKHAGEIQKAREVLK